MNIEKRSNTKRWVACEIDVHELVKEFMVKLNATTFFDENADLVPASKLYQDKELAALAASTELAWRQKYRHHTSRYEKQTLERMARIVKRVEVAKKANQVAP